MGRIRRVEAVEIRGVARERETIEMVRERVGGDAKEPRRKRDAAPFEPTEIPERLLKHLRSNVLRGMAIAGVAPDIGVDTVEIEFIDFGEAAWILLSRFD